MRTLYHVDCRSHDAPVQNSVSKSGEILFDTATNAILQARRVHLLHLNKPRMLSPLSICTHNLTNSSKHQLERLMHAPDTCFHRTTTHGAPSLAPIVICIMKAHDSRLCLLTFTSFDKCQTPTSMLLTKNRLICEDISNDLSIAAPHPSLSRLLTVVPSN